MTSGRDLDELLAGPESEPCTRVERAEPRGSRLDAWWARVLSTPARRRAWQWGGPAASLVLAAALRLEGLGSPHALVFDETYYVKDAWTLMHLGYEAQWPGDADAAFARGDADDYLPGSPSFIAHPQLGKWIIAAGLAVFGAGDSVGWRISTAVVGILTVALVMAIAHALLRSTVLTTIAGGLLAIDGNAIVMSRVALLDGSVTFFALLGFGAILLDRRWSERRLERWIARRLAAGRPIDWGPSLWWRPWLLAAAVALGLASSVKWSGFYFLAFFAVYTLAVDAAARRRAGIGLWGSGTVLRQAPVTFVLMVPLAAAVYVASWFGWFASGGGYDRRWVQSGGQAWSGLLAWVPTSVQNWWHYQVEIYDYNVGEMRPHAYQANPLTWLLMTRPTSMYYQAIDPGQDGCTASSGCGESITGIANPIIWWAAVAACVYLVYRLVRYREWRAGLILAGLAAGYLPWLLYLRRTVFQFYTIAFEPYLVLGLTMTIGIVLGTRADPTWRRVSGVRVVAIFLGFCVVVSAFFLPLWTGMQVPWWFIQLHYWLPGWR